MTIEALYSQINFTDGRQLIRQFSATCGVVMCTIGGHQSKHWISPILKFDSRVEENMLPLPLIIRFTW